MPRVAYNPLPWMLTPDGFDPAGVPPLPELGALLRPQGLGAIQADVPPGMTPAEFGEALRDAGLAPARVHSRRRSTMPRRWPARSRPPAAPRPGRRRSASPRCSWPARSTRPATSGPGSGRAGRGPPRAHRRAPRASRRGHGRRGRPAVPSPARRDVDRDRRGGRCGAGGDGSRAGPARARQRPPHLVRRRSRRVRRAPRRPGGGGARQGRPPRPARRRA